MTSPAPTAARLLGGLLRSAWPDVGALGLLALAASGLYLPWLLWGQLYYEPDTYLQFLPTALWYAEHLREGSVPLWAPDIFVGYPLFAQGEVGMLYPLHLLFYRLLTVETAFGFLRLLHTFLAAAFMYGFIRSLRLGTAALVGGLIFAFGSFLAFHMHHESIVRTAVWLPFALMCLEVGFRRQGWSRRRWFATAGLGWGVGALGVNIQPAMMSALAVGLYAVMRGLADFRWEIGGQGAPVFQPPAPTSVALLKRLAGMGLALGLAGVVGAGLAAAQWLPLYELGMASVRSGPTTYQFASEHASPPQGLISLLFPYFFRGADGEYWTRWKPWESFMYAGVIGLALALVGLAVVRRIQVWYFGVLGGASLMIALAADAPALNLHALVWALPGFSLLRAPGRFSYLVVFAIAGLAAFGAHWLVSSEGRRARGSLVIGSVLVVGLVALLTQMHAWNAWMLAEPETAVRWIAEALPSLLRGEGDAATLTAYQGLLWSTQLANRSTLLAFALLGAMGALLIARPLLQRAKTAWALGLAALVAVDMVVFAADFHPRGTLQELLPATEDYRYLEDLSAGSRVMVGEGLDHLRPNRLLGSGTYDVDGAGQLATRRHANYLALVRRTDGPALDLLGVEYVAFSLKDRGQERHKDTLFWPSSPLVEGVGWSALSQDSFRVPGWLTSEVRVIGSLSAAAEIEQGEQVAELTLEGADAQRLSVPVLAGLHVSDAAWERRDMQGAVRHALAEVARKQEESRPDGSTFQQNLYAASLALPQPVEVRQVGARSTSREGIFTLYGLGLVHPQTGAVHSVARTDRLKYSEVHRTDQVVILRNDAAAPRAFVVYSAVLPAPETPSAALAHLRSSAFDPARDLVLERPPPDGFPLRSMPDARAVRGDFQPAASVEDLHPEHVRMEAELIAPGYLVLLDAYYPGWEAYVDGDGPRPIYAANELFRAVPLEAGKHRVDFIFRPQSVRMGLLLTAAALVLYMAILAGAPLGLLFGSGVNRASRLV